MIKKKDLVIKIVILMLFFFLNYLNINNLIKILPDELENGEIIFTFYRNTILRENIIYLLIPIIIYINIRILNKYFNIYLITRYVKSDDIIRSITNDILKNNSIFLIFINLIFLINMIINFNIQYVNINFIIYIGLSLIIQIIGLTAMLLIIFLVNLWIKRIILSSFIVFALMTLQKAFLSLLKSDYKSIIDMIFYKCNFVDYLNNICIQVSFLVSFLFVSIFVYILIMNQFKKRDILNEKN